MFWRHKYRLAHRKREKKIASLLAKYNFSRTVNVAKEFRVTLVLALIIYLWIIVD
jgi:hypothetical protein